MANSANTFSANAVAHAPLHAHSQNRSGTVGAFLRQGVALVRKSALPILGLTTFFVGWHSLATWMAKPLLLPGPLDVLSAYQQLIADGTLKSDTLSSLKRVFTGFSIAAVIGVPLALILSVSTSLRYFAMPVLSVLRPIPPIAWIPLAILWFGIGDAPSFFITAIASFFPIFLNSLSGGCSVNENHIQAARCLGATSPAVVRHVVLPSAAPHIWTGLKIGLGQAWMAVVTAELIAAHSGLGYMIQVNRLNLETPAVLAGMLTIGILGALMAFSLSALERHLLPWRIQK